MTKKPRWKKHQAAKALTEGTTGSVELSPRPEFAVVQRDRYDLAATLAQIDRAPAQGADHPRYPELPKKFLAKIPFAESPESKPEYLGNRLNYADILDYRLHNSPVAI